MIVELDEMKGYLRVDHDDDNALITQMIAASEKQCLDILRTDDEEVLTDTPNGKLAVMFMTAYLYEHKEEANHNVLNLTLRSLLFGDRKAGF